MSEHVLKFLFHELEFVRFVCRNKKCGAVTEIPMDRLTGNILQDAKCPVCRADDSLVEKGKGSDWVHDVVNALQTLARSKGAMIVELGLSEEDVHS